MKKNALQKSFFCAKTDECVIMKMDLEKCPSFSKLIE